MPTKGQRSKLTAVPNPADNPEPSADEPTTTTDLAEPAAPEVAEDAITDEMILHGAGGAPAPEPEAPPAPPILDPFAPMTLDRFVPQSVDIQYKGKTYEMRPMEEFGSAGLATFYRHWGQAQQLEMAAQSGFYPDEEYIDPTLEAPDNVRTRKVPYEYEPEHDTIIRTHYEKIVRVFCPTMKQKVIDTMTDRQVSMLVTRFLALTGAEDKAEQETEETEE